MNQIPPVFWRFSSQILYFLLTPAFFLGFLLLYKPQELIAYFDMGQDMLSFNITMIACIILVCLVECRVSFYFLKKVMRLSWWTYACWCAGEMLLIALFMALYIFLMQNHVISYYEVLGTCLWYTLIILLHPYLLITLALAAYANSDHRKTAGDQTLIRFFDQYKKLKIMIEASSLLYIEADENYVRIHYLQRNRLKTYMLRCSMRSLEDLLSSHGIQRCHRSYYINPTHIKVLRKDTDGMVYAELDIDSNTAIPISKKYNQSIAQLI